MIFRQRKYQWEIIDHGTKMPIMLRRCIRGLATKSPSGTGKKAATGIDADALISNLFGRPVRKSPTTRVEPKPGMREATSHQVAGESVIRGELMPHMLHIERTNT